MRSTALPLCVTLVMAAALHGALGAAPLPAAQKPGEANPRAVAVKHFMERVDEYMKLHKDVADKVGPAHETKDAAKIVARQNALAEGIRAARANAKRGEIFLPEVQGQFREIIDADFAKRSARDEKAALKDVPDDPVRVNATYPEAKPIATMPPKILANLQRLPEPLEYRFMKRHLILLDVEANLIVDYIPNVLPPESK